MNLPLRCAPFFREQVNALGKDDPSHWLDVSSQVIDASLAKAASRAEAQLLADIAAQVLAVATACGMDGGLVLARLLRRSASWTEQLERGLVGAHLWLAFVLRLSHTCGASLVLCGDAPGLGGGGAKGGLAEKSAAWVLHEVVLACVENSAAPCRVLERGAGHGSDPADFEDAADVSADLEHFWEHHVGGLLLRSEGLELTPLIVTSFEKIMEGKVRWARVLVLCCGLAGVLPALKIAEGLLGKVLGQLSANEQGNVLEACENAVLAAAAATEAVAPLLSQADLAVDAVKVCSFTSRL